MKHISSTITVGLMALVQAWCSIAGAAQVFLETMASAPAKPWTGTGCDNAWTVTCNGANPFEQSTQWNYGPGNPCGLQFKQGTPNPADSMITTTSGITATGSVGYVEFYLWADGLGPNTGWTFRLDSGSGFVNRLSELNGINHDWQLYHYNLQAAELVSNLHLRFQFAGGSSSNRINLDYISVEVGAGTTNGTNPAVSFTAKYRPHPRRRLRYGRPL